MEMTTEEVERRIAHAILRLVNQAGRKVDDGIQIDFPITRQDLAELTGTTLHTVSRIFKRMGTAGISREREAAHHSAGSAPAICTR